MNNRMKMRSRGWAAALVGITLAVSSCDDDLADININPNDPVDVGAEYLFPNAVEAAVSRVIGTSLNVDLTGLWVQHYVEFEIPIEDLYDLTDGRVSTHWNGFYAGPLQDFQEVIEKGREEDRPNTEALGLIMKGWTAQVVTDLYGDVGYSEALRGRDPSVGLSVRLDPQEEVYRQLLDDVTRGVNLLDESGVMMSAADLIYGGDVEKWRRFGNSLRMRMAMRVSDATSSLIDAQQEFVNAYNAGGFESNDDSAILWYLDNGLNRHPIHLLYIGTGVKHSVSGTMIDTLMSLDDPRLPVYAEENAYGEYWGAPNASAPHEEPDTVSMIGDFYTSADSPGMLMTYAELLFLQAEAAQRGWIGASAADLYEDGIRAAMEFNGIAEADIAAYLAQPEITYKGGQEGLEQIWLQKWIALFGNGVEAYAEWRRTGYPVLTPGPDAVNDGLIPVRLFYPASEESLNAAALEEAMARQGNPTENTRVWWDTSDNQ